MDRAATITFQPNGKHGEVTLGKTIMEAARTMGIEISSICGGNMACGKCKVEVRAVSGGISPLTAEERLLLTRKEIRKGIRLACAAEIWGDIKVVVPEESRRGKQRLQTEGIETPIELDPCIRKITLNLTKTL